MQSRNDKLAMLLRSRGLIAYGQPGREEVVIHIPEECIGAIEEGAEAVRVEIKVKRAKWKEKSI